MTLVEEVEEVLKILAFFWFVGGMKWGFNANADESLQCTQDTIGLGSCWFLLENAQFIFTFF